MKPEEAIERLHQFLQQSIGIIEDADRGDDYAVKVKKDAEKDLSAIQLAIEALKEVQQYREIGTVEECREAREKQIPKKPVYKPKPYNESVGFNEEWFCPSCGAYIGYFYEGMDEPEQMEYCNECGQHIARDWSDKFDDE